MSASDQNVIDPTRRWISEVVIGLNLCPFARRVFQGELIRYVVSQASDAQSLKHDLTRELRFLASARIDEVETTLLIHPHVFADFLDFNDFQDDVERLVKKLGLEGTIQVASFHPGYQFAETEPDAVENYTNRSPYPMLHLLREESVSAIAGDPDELLQVPQQNIETLNALGIEKVQQLLRSIDHHTP